MDAIYGNLNRATKKELWESVHLSLIPSPDPASIDPALEARMAKAQNIVSLVRSLRNKSNLKVRQPLRRIIVPVSGEHERAEIAKMEDLILDEVNVKGIEYVTAESGIVHKSAKPNFKMLGPKYGKTVQAVAQAVKQMSAADIRAIEERGEVTLNAGGSPVTVAKEDVEIVREDLKGWLVESENGCTVALDVELTPELVEEGLAREFVNRVQNMRKDAGFDVTDRIRIFASGKGTLNKVLQQLGSYIKNETLAVEIAEGAGADGAGKGSGYTAQWDINGEQCTITIEKVGSNGSAAH